LKGLRKGRKTAVVTVIAMIEAEDQAGYKETEAENKGKTDY